MFKILAVFCNSKKVYLFSKDYLFSSLNGSDFNLELKKLSFSFPVKNFNEKILDFKISNVKKNCYIAVFKYKEKNKINFCLGISSDLSNWFFKEKISFLDQMGIIVSSYKVKKNYLMFFGENNIFIASSPNLEKWNTSPIPVLSPRKIRFDNQQISISNTITTEKGIFLAYLPKTKKNNVNIFGVGMALLDRKNPDQVLWRSNEPLWSQEITWPDKEITSIGIVNFKNKLISYWSIPNEGIFVVNCSFHLQNLSKPLPVLEKYENNPLIAPKSENLWEAFTTFNPTACYEDGKVHIIYRAQGHDYVSSFGYASSNDGVSISERLDKPIYTPKEWFEQISLDNKKKPNLSYVSGGGYGGCEDPRITRIEDRLYMIYVVFDGQSPPRLALTSIAVDDFLNQKWIWEKPILISKPGVVDKSGCLFPEKINNKYVVLHRIFPNILIDFVDSLDFNENNWLKGEFQIKIRENMWDSRKIGAGAPPLKTKDGWLLIYYAVDDRDDSQYKIGAMLLDLNDPTKVLYRTDEPILEPNLWYENEGFKAGVAYPCGAVIIKDTLFVYYGGADTVVCVATANLDSFLEQLKTTHTPHLLKAKVGKINLNNNVQT